MTRSATAALTLLTFAALPFVIAAWAARRTHNAVDFVLARRRLGVWMVALGFVANAVNPWMLMIMGAAAFMWGVAAVWLWGAILLGCVINMWFVAPRLRALAVGQGCATIVQVISADAGERLQPIVVRSATFIMLWTLLSQIGVMANAAGAVLLSNFGFEADAIIVVSIAMLAVCVLAGGLLAASALDVVQTAVVLAVSLFLLLPALVAIGGWEHVQAAFVALGPASMHWFGGKSGVVAVAFAAGSLGLALGMMGQPHAVNRFMAAKDEPTLRAARWVALAWSALLATAVFMCAWCASVLYAGLAQPEHALLAIASRLLPPGLGAVITAAVLAAIILAIASQLLALATSLAVDLRRMGSPMSLPWVRAALVAMAAVTMIISVYVPVGVLDQAMYAFTALGASFGPLLLVRLSGKRTRPGSILGAMWAGFVLSLVFHLLPDSPGDFLERVLPFIASLGIALTGGERRRNPDRADRAQETVHDRVPI
jgi:sodium/proline symporter